MMGRYLRIAFSAVCGVICLLLIVLWVRSERTWDSLHWHSGWGLGLTSFDSRIQLALNSGKTDFPKMKRGISYNTLPDNFTSWPEQTGFARFGFHTSSGAPGVRFVQFPLWLPALLTAFMAVVPWIHWQFSLRTLLIAMTLVAVLLGIIVALN